MELPKTNQALRVATLSLTQRNQALLEFFFANAGHSRFVMTDENQADAAIFDFDNMASRLHWERFYAERQKPGIALSVTAQEVPMTCWVQKPVTPVAMMEAANRLRNGDWYQPAVSKEVLLDAVASADPVVAEPVANNDVVIPEVQKTTEIEITDIAETPPVVSVAETKSEAAPPAPVPMASVVTPPSAPAVKAVSTTVPASSAAQASAGQAKKGGGFLSRLWGMLTGGEAEAEVKPGVTPNLTSTAPPAPKTVNTPPAPQLAQTSMLRSASAPATAEKAAVASTPVVTPSATVAEVQPATVANKPEAVQPPPQAIAPATPATPATPAAPPVSSKKAVTPPVTKPAPSQTSAPPAPRSISTTPAAPVSTAKAAHNKDKGKEHKTETKAKPEAKTKPTAATVSTSEKLKPEASERELAEAPTYCGEHVDVPVGQIAQTSSLFYNYNDYLIAALRETHLVGARWRSPTRLDLDFGTVIYVPLENCMYLDFPEERLYSELSVCHPGRYKVRMVAVQEFADMQSDLPHYHRLPRFDAMLWKLALQTSLGRLPQDTDLKQELFLKAWPNMTRFQPTPHAMRIAALWANHGATLLETIQKLDIPQRYVFAFYNAAFSSDLLTTDGSRIKQAKRRSHKSQGTWSRLFSWLRRA